MVLLLPPNLVEVAEVRLPILGAFPDTGFFGGAFPEDGFGGGTALLL